MPLAIESVPNILEYISKVRSEPLSKYELNQILAQAEQTGEPAATTALKMGVVSSSELQRALIEQGVARAEAAAQDIQTIAHSGKQAVWIQPHWGNGAYELESPTLVDSLVSLANIAQKTVLMANKHPTIAEELVPSINAAKKLVKAFSYKPHAGQTTTEEVSKLWKQVADGLRIAVVKSHEAPEDAKGNPIDIDDYIAKRGAEITKPHADLVNMLNGAPRDPLASRAGIAFSDIAMMGKNTVSKSVF